METSGRYIGTPNGIVLCVDRNDGGIVEGRMFHGCSETGIPFRGCENIVKEAEGLFNALGFPHVGTGDRDIDGNVHRFRKKEGMARVMGDEELLEQHGDLGTFVIRVQHRQHSSWQGRVTDLDKDQTVYFRSALELIKIIDGALDRAERTEDGEGK